MKERNKIQFTKLIISYSLFFAIIYGVQLHACEGALAFAASEKSSQICQDAPNNGNIHLHQIANIYLEAIETQPVSSDLFLNIEFVKKISDELPHFQTSFSQLPENFSLSKEEIDNFFYSVHEELFKEKLAPQINLLPSYDPLSLSFFPASTPSSYGAKVFFIRNRETGLDIAVIKIRYNEIGFRELVQTVAAERILERAKESQSQLNFAKILAAGQLDSDRYFIVQAVAPGKDINCHLRKLANEGLRADCNILENAALMALLENTANAIAKLHLYLPFSARQSEAVRSKFADNLEEKIQRRIETRVLGPNGILESAKNRKEITVSTYELLTERMRKLVCAYRSHINILSFYASFVHGDFHGGNLVFDDQTGISTLIDYGSVVESFSNRGLGGHGDPASDIGKMVADLEIEALKNSLDIEQSKNIGRAFLSVYKEKININPDIEVAFDISVELNRSWYFALTLSNRNSVRFQSYQSANTEIYRRQIENDLANKIFLLWSDPLINRDISVFSLRPNL